jgi:hypothetical protein
MWLIFLILGLAVLAVIFGVALAAIVSVAIKLGPVLLIVLGGWLLLRAIGGSRHGRHHRDDWRQQYGRHQHGRPWPGPAQGRMTPSRPPQPARPPQPTARPIARSTTPPRRELPIDVQVKVDQIQRKADMLLGYADRFPPFSQDLHIVRQTAADYLPRTVEAYKKLTGTHDPILTATGRSALDELRSQLSLLDSKLDEIAQDLQRQDLNRMLANRRFLEDRFKLRDLQQQEEQEQDAKDPKADTSAA